MYWLIIVSSLISARSDSLEIRFVGNAGFELFDGDTTVLVDLPYQSGYSGYMEYRFEDILARGDVTSAITHRHADHVEPSLLLRAGWSLFGPDEVSEAFPSDLVLKGDSVTFGNFKLSKFRTPHRDTEHYSIIVAWKGFRMYFVGDTEDPTHLLSTKDLDIVFTTPWLSCEVEDTGETVDTERTILLHHFADQRYGSCGSPEVIKQGSAIQISVPD